MKGVCTSFWGKQKLRDERLSQWRLLSLGDTFKVSSFESFAAIRLYKFFSVECRNSENLVRFRSHFYLILHSG